MIKQGLLKSSTTLKGLVSSRYFPVLQDAILDFDFENSRYYSPASGYYSNFLGTTGLTVTRSNGTYFDSNGNIVVAEDNKPRFNHDPETLESLGIMREEQRVNLAISSKPLAGDWALTGSGSQEDANANALGTFGGVRVISGGALFERINHPNIAMTIGETYATTIYYQEGTSGRIRILFRNLANGDNTIVEGEVGALSVGSSDAGTAVVKSDILLADGVTRKAVILFTTVGDNLQIGIGASSSTAGEDVIALGLQVELGDFETSFIPSNGSELTRTTEIIDVSGLDYPVNGEGTLYAETSTEMFGTSSPYVMQLDEGNNSDRFIVRYDATAGVKGFSILDNDTSYSASAGTAPSSSVYSKSAFAFDNSSVIAAFNGVTSENSTNPQQPPVDTTFLRIGSSVNGTSMLNGHIKRLAVISRKYTEQEMQDLTYVDFSPTDIPNLLTWIDAGDESTISEVSGSVSQIDDKSGNGNDVVQSSGASQPTTGASTLNGNNIIDFNGSSYMEGMATTESEATIVSVYDVVIPNDGLPDARVCGIRGTTAGARQTFGQALDNSLRYDGSSATGSIPSVTGSFIRISQRSSSIQKDYINGAINIDEGSGVVGDISGFLNIGNVEVSFLRPLYGSVGEVMYFNRILTSEEISMLGNYLSIKWGIEWAE